MLCPPPCLGSLAKNHKVEHQHSNVDENHFINVGYIADHQTMTIAALAQSLQRPILIEGPPGTGKTALAKALAKMNDVPLLRIQCYEGITAEQVIGEFNYTKQLLAIEHAKKNQTALDLENVFTKEFFIERPLLKAFLHPSKVVLLIDEIDRADEEFEAFLLEALGEYQITVPELGTIPANQIPIIILTSNATRTLSHALRRRSLYLHLDYPSPEREIEIIRLHVPDIAEQIAKKIVSIAMKLRETHTISQPPSIAETIDFAKAIAVLGKEFLDETQIEGILGVLIKNRSDLNEAKEILKTSLSDP